MGFNNTDRFQNNGPLISVIVPNFNNARFLRGAIQSILQQAYKNYEIIVVDDGSTDNSQEAVVEFGDKVKYIWQENQGLAGARNTGIRAACGEFIGLLDADDEWNPNYLETMISLTNKYPEASVFYCTARSMDVDGHDLPQFFGGPAVPPDEIYHILLRANFLIPSTILIKRSAVIEAGLFDQNLRSCEDWDLWLRILPVHKIVGTSKCLVRYRVHGNSLSTNPSGMQQATRMVIEKQFGPDDGQWQTWSQEKRRAYGGVYRYHVLTSIQRQNDWQVASDYMCRALQLDPTLSTDLNLFYDLALGSQPIGYRGTSYQLNMENNSGQIEIFLNNVFSSCKSLELQSIRPLVFGTAYYALGLVAYNTGEFQLCRKYFIKAITHRPNLITDTLLMGDLIKSIIGRSFLERIKGNGIHTHN